MQPKRRQWKLFSIVAFSPQGCGITLPPFSNGLIGTKGVSSTAYIIGDEIILIMNFLAHFGLLLQASLFGMCGKKGSRQS